jgi:response regulator RpfG family c-di-GMP phosphodiesterase
MNGILVVDDDLQSRYMLEVLLQGNGHRVVTAANGAEALETARRDPPRLVVSDILMPVMDGYTLCRHWRADERLKHIPFVFYTASYTEAKDQVLGLELGAVHVIVKPEQPDILLQKVNQVLELTRAAVTPASAKAEREYLKEYSEVLFHKLEQKTAELEQANAALRADIAARERAEQATRKLNRALATIHACNEAMIRSRDESQLLDQVCRVLIQFGGYRLAWVGYVQTDPDRSIAFAAHAGDGDAYLAGQELSWTDCEHGRGPSGAAVRSGKHAVCQDIAADPAFAPWRDEALRRGYASMIALPLTNREGSFGVLAIYSDQVNAFDKKEIELLIELAGDLAYGIGASRAVADRDRALEERQQHLGQLRRSLEDSIQAIAATIELRDPYTAGHQRRVTELAVAIARSMELPDERVAGLHLAGIIHDLGKIHVPSDILSKPGPLSSIEYMLIKGHPQAGYDILKGIEFPWPLADIVLQHHECMDGSGYPQGLRGEEILLEARILGVADVVEAMSSHRPYRPGLGIEAALEEIARERGVAYDAEVVDACVKLFRQDGFGFS